MAGFWYLATPYRGYQPPGWPNVPREKVFELAAEAAAKFAARLIDQGLDVYCPIAHGHAIAPFVKAFGAESQRWAEMQRPFMEAAHGLIVGTLPGWGVSHGITHEIAYFAEGKRPIHFVSPDFISLTWKD